MQEEVGMDAFVYFMLDEAGACKIGKSVGPDRRRIAVENAAGSGVSIHHVVATNDAYWLEAKLHRFFATRRLGGEWFVLTDAELEDVRKMTRHDHVVIGGRDLDAPWQDG